MANVEKRRQIDKSGRTPAPNATLPGGNVTASFVLSTFLSRAEVKRARGEQSRDLSNIRSQHSLRHSIGDDQQNPARIDRTNVYQSRTSSAKAQEANMIMQSIINSSPGTYAHEDGSTDIRERYNFYIHGKRYLFATNSLAYFDETSLFRQSVIRLVTSSMFERCVLFLICANSLILGLADMNQLNSNGELDSSSSMYNTVVNYASTLFTILFSVECILKVIAMGLVIGHGSYLADPWNWIDLIVVLFGLAGSIPELKKFSILRAFRPIRPIRLVNAMPGIKKLVSALLKSMPELLSVVVCLSFFFFLYGVIGVQIWKGEFHQRCRLTPYPVALDPTLTMDNFTQYQDLVLQNVSKYRCRDEYGMIIPLETSKWSHDTSPWNSPRICYWAVVPEESPRSCNLQKTGYRTCPTGQTCGSDYDEHGNFRFTHPDKDINRRILQASTFNAEMKYGMLTFDNIWSAVLILFLCMPREGWSAIMYQLFDAGSEAVSVFYFLSFVFITSYVVLNLALAVIWDNFAEEHASDAAAQHTREIQLTAKNLTARLLKTHSLSEWRKKLGKVVKHRVFNFVRIGAIVMNTIILCLDKHPMDDKLQDLIDHFNFKLSLWFVLEVVLLILGLGYTQWAYDRYNLLDAVVATIAVIDICVMPPKFLVDTKGANLDSMSWLAGVRAFRILTLFKIARSWSSLHKLLVTIFRTIREVGNFSVLLFLVVYVYALVGMQIFGNQLRFDQDGYVISSTDSIEEREVHVPRANFDSIAWAMVTVFQILTGENWSDVMLDGWRTVGPSTIFYFVSLVVIGNFVLLNLFLAIMLGNFEDTSDQEQFLTEKEELRSRSRVFPIREVPRGSNTLESKRRSRTEHRNSLVSVEPTDSEVKTKRSTMMTANGLAKDPYYADPDRKIKRRSATNSAVVSTFLATNSYPEGASLFIFSSYNPIRQFAWKLIKDHQFDKVVLMLVAMSSISVAIDTPLDDPDSMLVFVRRWVDFTLTLFFTIEIVLKVIARGFYMHPDAYLRNGWNMLDFFITFVSLPGLADPYFKIKALSPLRYFRALRPLRMISRSDGLKFVISSLFAAIPGILNVLVVSLLLVTIFSILAVNNLKGTFYSCSGSAFDALSYEQQYLITFPRPWTNLTINEQSWFNETESAIYQTLISSAISNDSIRNLTSHSICELLGAQWQKTIPQQFNNVYQAMLTLFEISTTEGWATIMLTSVDATDIDMQPQRDFRIRWALFYVTYIFVVAFFIIQLFIGVVIDNFNRMKEKLDGTNLLSGSQREWLTISTAILNMKPRRKFRVPRSGVRRLCFQITCSPYLDNFIMGCIVLNTFIMGITFYGEEDVFSEILKHSNHVFAAIYTIEAVIKIIGLRRYYWVDSWNIFDFVIVLASSSSILYTLVSGMEISGGDVIIRSLRTAKLIKLVQAAPSLRQFVNTLIVTLPSLASIGWFLALVFFIYAAIGVQLFGTVELDTYITENTNFQRIDTAMITLLRSATGEQWSMIMHELATKSEGCVDQPTFNSSVCGFTSDEGCIPLNGCGSPVAIVYYCTFTLIVTFVLLNIFIAVILEGFANEKDRADSVLLPHHYENFIANWSVFDPDATGYMEWHVLPKLIQCLDEPLGFGPTYNPSENEMSAFLDHLNLSIYQSNKVFFSDVARSLAKFVLDVVNHSTVADLPSTLEIDQKWKAVLKGKSQSIKGERCVYRLNHIHAAVLLHDAIRSRLFREELASRVQMFTAMTKKVLRKKSKEDKVIEGLSDSGSSSEDDIDRYAFLFR